MINDDLVAVLCVPPPHRADYVRCDPLAQEAVAEMIAAIFYPRWPSSN